MNQTLDFVKNFNAGASGGDDSAARQQQGTDGAASSAGQGEGGGLMGKLNELGGGGQRGEANEDYLDKGVDMVQGYMGKGDQSNESAAEQLQDEVISDQIRAQYKNVTGSDFPVADK